MRRSASPPPSPTRACAASCSRTCAAAATGGRWQANLDLFAADAARGRDSRIADFPATGAPPWDGPVVWLVGGDSGYVRDEDGRAMRALFPRTRLVTVKGVGHWVHSEAPEVVTETLRRVVRAVAAEDLTARVGPWPRCCTSPVPSSSAPRTSGRRRGWSAAG